MEESIYNLIPSAQGVPQRPPMHRSLHPGQVHPKDLEFGAHVKKPAATFGYPNGTNAIPQGQFTKAHSKEPTLPQPAAPTQPKQKIKAPVPKKDEKPVMGLSSGKDFIKTNAINAILSQPPKPEPEFLWTQKPDFGEVPMYMKRVKAQIRQEKENMESYMRMRGQPETGTRVTQLSESERAELIRHLKLKWASVNTGYQKQSISIDSAVKKHKKEEMERQLAEIERDIKTLERGEVVLVVDDE